MIDNVPEFSVSDLSLAVKQTIEGSFSHVRVRGELSRITIAKSGHLYSDLKDDNAVINVVCWKGSMQKLSIRPEEGMEVICTGRLTTFPNGSRYQLIIESMELAGEGALLKLLEQRKQKLMAEGLFDAAHKKPLPFMPRTIGVVTSPTGAVIRDIIHRVTDRFPCHIIVWPVLVQGQNAAEQIARGIDGFNKLKSANRPDVIIVARGGGSLEDLMAFNEEIVVRAAYASDIPLISAVGHETDTTLIDFAADMRAPTPTGAAEMAVPVLDNIRAKVMEDGIRLNQSVRRICDTYTQMIERSSSLFTNPMRMIEPLMQKFDSVADKLNNGFERMIERKDKSLHGFAGRLQSPRAVIDRAELNLGNATKSLQSSKKILFDIVQNKVAIIAGRLRSPDSVVDKSGTRLGNASHALSQSGERIIPPSHDRLAALGRMLESLSYKNTLARGFAVLKDENNFILDTSKALSNAKTVTATVKDADRIIIRG